MNSLQKARYIIILFSFSVILACHRKPENERPIVYKVRLAFEPGFYGGAAIDTVLLSKPSINDTSNPGNGLDSFVIHRFFKIPGGELNISAVSNFEREYSKTVNINSDTTIIFYKKDFAPLFETKQVWEKDLELKKNDTVVIRYSNSSCATSREFASVRKISVFKSDSVFTVKYTDQPLGTAEERSGYKTKTLDKNFINQLARFYYAGRKISERKQTDFSTLNAAMEVRVGDNIFYISESLLSSKKSQKFYIGKLYNDFILMINGSNSI